MKNVERIIGAINKKSFNYAKKIFKNVFNLKDEKDN